MRRSERREKSRAPDGDRIPDARIGRSRVLVRFEAGSCAPGQESAAEVSGHRGALAAFRETLDDRRSRSTEPRTLTC
jgi:hypothetical protein